MCWLESMEMSLTFSVSASLIQTELAFLLMDWQNDQAGQALQNTSQTCPSAAPYTHHSYTGFPRRSEPQLYKITKPQLYTKHNNKFVLSVKNYIYISHLHLWFLTFAWWHHADTQYTCLDQVLLENPLTIFKRQAWTKCSSMVSSSGYEQTIWNYFLNKSSSICPEKQLFCFNIISIYLTHLRILLFICKMSVVALIVNLNNLAQTHTHFES